MSRELGRSARARDDVDTYDKIEHGGRGQGTVGDRVRGRRASGGARNTASCEGGGEGQRDAGGTPLADRSGGHSGTAPSGRALLRTAAAVLRADLAPGRRDPLPRHRHLSWLPHAHLALLCLIVGLWNRNLYEHAVGPLPGLTGLCVLGIGAAPVLALVRPAAAWWLSTASLWLTAALTERAWGGSWPWSDASVALHGLVLLLLALRVRPLAAATALGVTLLTGFGAVPPYGVPHPPVFAVGAVVFTAATLVGSALRATRVSRTRLVQQEELTAEERARRALLEERGRIARELHDVVAHHMSVISIQAQVAPHLVADPSPELRENLAGIRQNAVDALTELRRVLGVLRGDTTGEGGAAGDRAAGVRYAPQPTLDRLGELLANVRAAGLDVTAELIGERRPLSPGVELSAYRIVQEALSNVIRHAPGARATVTVHHQRAGLTVRVTNTAPTRAPDRPGAARAAGEPGHGLLGMRERAAMLGGELAAGPTPDGGWDVTATLPVPVPRSVPVPPSAPAPPAAPAARTPTHKDGS
ncbi:sensor histidine kinase [Streptomyces sp. NPDC090025]|uniref:sensor histidine kinase n=1 Tax=Streptomyces sp. NPDC090025 TaxID=3365922 RepID=UPI0038367B69